jgi:hypothetical protein
MTTREMRLSDAKSKVGRHRPLGSSSNDDVRKAQQIKDSVTPSKLSKIKGDVGLSHDDIDDPVILRHDTVLIGK